MSDTPQLFDEEALKFLGLTADDLKNSYTKDSFQPPDVDDLSKEIYEQIRSLGIDEINSKTLPKALRTVLDEMFVKIGRQEDTRLKEYFFRRALRAGMDAFLDYSTALINLRQEEVFIKQILGTEIYKKRASNDEYTEADLRRECFQFGVRSKDGIVFLSSRTVKILSLACQYDDRLKKAAKKHVKPKTRIEEDKPDPSIAASNTLDKQLEKANETIAELEQQTQEEQERAEALDIEIESVLEELALAKEILKESAQMWAPIFKNNRRLREQYQSAFRANENGVHHTPRLKMLKRPSITTVFTSAISQNGLHMPRIKKDERAPDIDSKIEGLKTALDKIEKMRDRLNILKSTNADLDTELAQMKADIEWMSGQSDRMDQHSRILSTENAYLEYALEETA